MEDFYAKARKVNRIEFLVATVLLTFFVIVILTDDEEARAYAPPADPIIPFANFYLRSIVEFTTMYLSFILLSQYVVLKLIRKEALLLNIVLIAVVFVILGVVFGRMDFGFAPLAIFAVYTALKYGLIYLWSVSKAIQSRYRFLAPGVLLAIALWVISIFFFIIGEAEKDVIAVWATLIPFGFFLYSYSFYSLIPAAMERKRPFRIYLSKVILVLLYTELPLVFLAFIFTYDTEAPVMISLVNALFQLAVTVPFSWILYKRYTKGNEEITSLKRELGQSAASIDFLRSQINPHFLFNALNTLYGTALQEKAERTAEGVQKLGDMMRFMLQENMQEKIPLSREIEYVDNYINLQRLRTDAIPGVTIHADITHHDHQLQMPPMLLIPFVENAFKHGISFREPSYIRIMLAVNGNTLHFDVSNSNHPKPENDPEKHKSGIGLTNVKQRLQLLYPGKHELIIRETAREFFIHLTIQLS